MDTIICEIDQKSASSRVVSSDHEVQFVPAKISFSGSEEIKPYFTNFIREDKKGSFNSALRGRPLTGWSDLEIFLLHT